MDELKHYGIKEQKWGVRRFQNPDGTLTSEGRKRYRKELRKDRNEAFVKGRDASVASAATKLAIKKEAGALEKAARNPSPRNINKYENAKEATNVVAKYEQQKMKELKEHHTAMIKKYGKESVSELAYNKDGTYKDRTVHGSEVVASIVGTMASFTLATVAGSPMAFVFTPKGRNAQARDIYRQGEMTARYNIENKRAKELSSK